jgi:hypothetical protein
VKEVSAYWYSFGQDFSKMMLKIQNCGQIHNVSLYFCTPERVTESKSAREEEIERACKVINLEVKMKTKLVGKDEGAY